MRGRASPNSLLRERTSPARTRRSREWTQAPQRLALKCSPKNQSTSWRGCSSGWMNLHLKSYNTRGTRKRRKRIRRRRARASIDQESKYHSEARTSLLSYRRRPPLPPAFSSQALEAVWRSLLLLNRNQGHRQEGTISQSNLGDRPRLSQSQSIWVKIEKKSQIKQRTPIQLRIKARSVPTLS